MLKCLYKLLQKQKIREVIYETENKDNFRIYYGHSCSDAAAGRYTDRSTSVTVTTFKFIRAVRCGL